MTDLLAEVGTDDVFIREPDTTQSVAAQHLWLAQSELIIVV